MAGQLPNWPHRLWCKAFAFRGANAVLHMPYSADLLVGHCHACRWTRVVKGDGLNYFAGQMFWPTDR